MGMFRVGLFGLVLLAGCSRSKASSSGSGADAGDPVSLAQALASGIAGNMQPGVNINAATGHVERTGTGAWTFDGGTCYSGDNDGFFGVFVKSKTDPHVWIKLVKDPIKQWTLAVSDPPTCKTGSSGKLQCDMLYFESNECSKLDVAFQSYTFRGRRTGGGHQFDGTATFDCTRDKTHVSGTLTVDKCSP